MTTTNEALKDAMLDYTLTSDENNLDLLLRIREQADIVIAEKQNIKTIEEVA